MRILILALIYSVNFSAFGQSYKILKCTKFNQEYFLNDSLISLTAFKESVFKIDYDDDKLFHYSHNSTIDVYDIISYLNGSYTLEDSACRRYIMIISPKYIRLLFHYNGIYYQQKYSRIL